jgi:triosephosphate isomerase
MVEILFQSEHTENSGKHTKAGREIASLEPRQGVSGHANPRSQLGERHATTQASQAQALAEGLSSLLSLGEKRSSGSRHWSID